MCDLAYDTALKYRWARFKDDLEQRGCRLLLGLLWVSRRPVLLRTHYDSDSVRKHLFSHRCCSSAELCRPSTQKNVTPAQASFICAIVLTYCFVSPTSLFIGTFAVNPNVPENLWAFSNTFRFRKIPSELGLLFQESLVGKNLTRILKACNYLAAFDQETSNRCQWGS